MVIGQGNVLVTPIQLAVGYVGVATGRLLQPHIFKEARNSEGNVVLTAQTVETGVPNIEQDYYDYMRDALHGMATEDSTVAPLFAERGISAASKTGTAEVFGKEDFALFAAMHRTRIRSTWLRAWLRKASAVRLLQPGFRRRYGSGALGA